MAVSLSISAVRSRDIGVSLFLVAFISFLLFSHLMPITDPVESNYALTAKEMVGSADWLSPRIYGQVWYDKPVFFYWLTALAFKWFGFSDMAARVVPALFGGLGVVLLYWFITKTSSQAAALLSALVMATSFEYVLLAKFVITDMVLFVFSSAALVFFYLAYTGVGGTKRWYLPMYVSMALAVLTKGPVGLLLPSLVVVSFILVQRKWMELRQMSILPGLFLFLVVALPWYAAMYYVHGSEFTTTFFGVHNYLRATVSEHPKDNVIYFYIVVFLLSMLPWSLLTVKALVAGAKGYMMRTSSLRIFCFIWAGVYLIFYSLMATKYLTYTFPTLFPLAILTGHYLERVLFFNKKSTIHYWVGLPVYIATFAMVGAAYFELDDMRLPVVAGSLMLIITVAWWQIRKRHAKTLLSLFCAFQILVYIALFFLAFPALADTRSDKKLAQDLAEYGSYRLGFYEFYSTSAVYYGGKTAVKLVAAAEAAMPEQPGLSWSSKYTMPTESLRNFVSSPEKERTVIVVPQEQTEQFLGKIKDQHVRLLKTTEKYNYYNLID
ncbi:ArnT family glycosyltransferase [Sporomusa acidovorans]|uniref:Undecaprenyl phosphate-alpha-4-amino-4-deoxy-L-arabinose arabinosyl transferase n=1 Tax=Sporomusa acidovorans (strain ATCC 49682 / DSM 3132 / Mol) TaxID=1123286 RepID=A0ABZ3J007_SPOA4|nr:glycosyltransferase family 39 protein [Sporomusa acidovorans]OZC22296.1 undecaprenyl phosphate-alpha-4-amino-4-deoxy-L-arabinose arabinosyl transferase [Sporomusa acidovorans DSM 3132]SDF36094.1 4-amino-4-deoxy-L-arabinose transferase [Sporomusa acidovorans]